MRIFPVGRLCIGFGLAILLFIAMVGASYWITSRLQETSQSAARAHGVVEAVTDLHHHIVEGDGYVRDYLSGDSPLQLGPLNSANDAMWQSVKTLRSLSDSASVTQTQLNDLNSQLLQRTEFVNLRIAERKARVIPPAEILRLLQQLELRTHRIHRLLDDQIASSERTRLAGSISRADASAASAAFVNGFGGLLGIGVLLAAAWVAVRDVRARQRAEVKSRQSRDAAEAASQAKSEFLANMSHEIRTPMNGILGMTDLALDTDLTTEQREYLGMVKSSGLSLLAVINDILDFSKIEAGYLELDNVEFELAHSVGAVMRTLGVRAQQKGLELACQIAADVPEALVGDAGRFCQVLVNLIGNAIKFTEHGEVIVRVETEARIGDELSLHVTVQDTGIGVSADKQAMIFDAFSQADNSITRKYGGTGLGLAISAKLVSLMGGRLWVGSVAGQGSTFHFTSRMRIGHGSVARRVRIPPPKLVGTSVLVVDDNATNRRILAEMVSRWGMRPVAVSGGEAAMSLLTQATTEGTSFPLVILDAHMPDVDGFAVAERIKSNPAMANAAVIMLTSSGRLGDIDRCRLLGIAIHLLKPVSQGDLLEAVISALHLSLERAMPCQSNVVAVSPEKRRTLKMLLAEDNPVNQRLAAGLLEKRGHTVVIAADGKQALAALEREPFDLMFMDVQMPEMGGFEATARIRDIEKQTGKHLPIIAMTAYAMKGDRERCLDSGMDGYISKPIMAVDLIRVIDETLVAVGQRLTLELL